MNFFNTDGKNLSTKTQEENNLNINESDNNVELNKINTEYFNNLMQDSKTKKDTYYDKDNAFVRLILIILGIIIIFGTIIIFFKGVI